MKKLAKILLRIFIVLAAIILLFVGIVATQPADFRITRSAVVVAPPAAVFEQVNDFHNWQEWSPWAKLDPNARATFSGPAAGVGAAFNWAGNDKIGEGAMAITGSHPSDLIRIKIDFIKPYPASNIAEFTFVPQEQQTLVTWTMTGHNNFMGRAVGLFMNMDKIVGGDFEKGLTQMKARVETARAATHAATSP